MGIQNILIEKEASLRQALELIDKNALGVVFVTSKEGVLVGLLSDGDIRRALLNGSNLGTIVGEIMNTHFTALSVETEAEVLLSYINDRVKIIPLIDESNKVVDYATKYKIKPIGIASPLLSGNELAYVTDCIKTNWISSQGKYVRKFEELFSAFHQEFQALAVSNGTVALHLALEALGIKEGDEVIVPNLTFVASINAILYARATPVLVDIDSISWNIDPVKIKEAITSKTKAIMPVHLYGNPCDMDKIMQIARNHNLLVVEDCAEALGSYYKGKPVGTFGDASTFSFFGNKTITTGEGGMTLFKDPKVAEKALVLRDHGMSKTRRYWHEEVGYNYRLTNLQAAVGVAQFERLEEFVQAKRKIASAYTETLQKFSCFQLPIESDNTLNTYWLYTLLVKPEAKFTRDDIMKYLANKGIETRPVFYPAHVMPPYQKYAGSQDFKNTELVSTCGFSLPSSVHLEEEQLEHICITIKEFLSKF